jgi:hypothetical protein
MELTAKVYLILALIFVVMIIQLAFARKNASKQTSFPLMINAFRANFTTINPLKIAYDLRHMGSFFEFFPIISNEIYEFLDAQEVSAKFKQKKSKSYFIMLKVTMNDLDVDSFVKEFSMKFNVVKIEERTSGTYEVFIKEKFSQLNLTRMTKFVTGYLKKHDPSILSAPQDQAETDNNILQ